MKVVIFAGGFGTRIGEESDYRPKPMVEIGGRPMLWHIMKYYSTFGFKEFIILGGYKQEMIKKYFQDYFLSHADVTFSYNGSNNMKVHKNHCEGWTVTVIDTGLDTMTGGRLGKVKEYIGNEPFLLTYGDGLSDIDIKKSIEQHKKSGALVTLTAFQPEEKFGVLEFSDDVTVKSFKEKQKNPNCWINAGFFVVEPAAIDYIDGDSSVWEQEPLSKIASDGKLSAYKHDGFWMCMDTLRDKRELEKIWKSGAAPWKIWK